MESYQIRNEGNAEIAGIRYRGADRQALRPQRGRIELCGLLVDDHVGNGGAELAQDRQHHQSCGRRRRNEDGGAKNNAANEERAGVRPTTSWVAVDQVATDGDGRDVRQAEQREVDQRAAVKVERVEAEAVVRDHVRHDVERQDQEHFSQLRHANQVQCSRLRRCLELFFVAIGVFPFGFLVLNEFCENEF